MDTKRFKLTIEKRCRAVTDITINPRTKHITVSSYIEMRRAAIEGKPFGR